MDDRAGISRRINQLSCPVQHHLSIVHHANGQNGAIAVFDDHGIQMVERAGVGQGIVNALVGNVNRRAAEQFRLHDLEISQNVAETADGDPGTKDMLMGNLAEHLFPKGRLHPPAIARFRSQRGRTLLLEHPVLVGRKPCKWIGLETNITDIRQHHLVILRALVSEKIKVLQKTAAVGVDCQLAQLPAQLAALLLRVADAQQRVGGTGQAAHQFEPDIISDPLQTLSAHPFCRGFAEA